MADIDIQRKRPGAGLLLAVVAAVALLVWLLSALFDGDDDEVAGAAPGVGGDVAQVETLPVALVPVVPVTAVDSTGPQPQPVRQYLSQCTGATAEMSPDHRFTSGCIQQLSAAMDAVFQMPGGAGSEIQAELDDLRTRADRLVSSPDTATAHAQMTRESFTAVATLLDRVQAAHFPNLAPAVDQLQRMAQAIDSDARLLQQKEAVQNFFQQAGEVVRAIGRTTPAAGG